MILIFKQNTVKFISENKVCNKRDVRHEIAKIKRLAELFISPLTTGMMKGKFSRYQLVIPYSILNAT